MGEPVRRRVIVAGNLHVVVDAGTGDLPFGELKAVYWQGFERRGGQVRRTRCGGNPAVS